MRKKSWKRQIHQQRIKQQKKNIIQLNKQLMIIKLPICCKPPQKKRHKHTPVQRKNFVQDCVECNWAVFGQTPQLLYQANQIVSASGTLDISSNTPGMTEVTMLFAISGTEVTHFTLTNRQCLAFTVNGFDAISIQGNAVSPLESAAGRFCLTPRYAL